MAGEAASERTPHTWTISKGTEDPEFPDAYMSRVEGPDTEPVKVVPESSLSDLRREVEEALRAADIAIEHAERNPRSFIGTVGQAKLIAYRNLREALSSLHTPNTEEDG